MQQILKVVKFRDDYLFDETGPKDDMDCVIMGEASWAPGYFALAEGNL